MEEKKRGRHGEKNPGLGRIRHARARRRRAAKPAAELFRRVPRRAFESH